MIIYPEQKEHRDLLGGKAKALSQLCQIAYPIPSWFAVSGEVRPDILEMAAKKLNADTFAVRSSARGEDGAQHSFAGQYDTFLFVPRQDLAEKIKLVQQSANSAHLESYQNSKKITEVHQPTALVQVMLNPTVSGVAFSADPLSGDVSRAVISATWGVGSALVSGEVDADTWTIDKYANILQASIAEKTHKHVIDQQAAEGVSFAEVEAEQQHIPCLTETQLREVAKLVRACSTHFNCPQDIEWAIAEGQLYLLQSRPITTLNSIHPDPNSPLTVWDNSNIAESYSGITSPLTFSFAERIYEHVYREFCILLSVPKKRILTHDHVFPKMLGHIHGHVYYNLNSWYHVLAMLPGFSVNRAFMEQMMGVKEPMPKEVVDDIFKSTQTTKLKDSWALLHTLIGLVRNHLALPKQIKTFYQRLNLALRSHPKPLEEMTGEELILHYQELESKLLKRWDAPLVNDFFAMIFYGVQRSLCEKWLGDADIQNKLLLHSGDIISAEPPRRIKKMAQLLTCDGYLARLLANPEIPSSEKLDALSGNTVLEQAYHTYLEDFGDRCLEELKLESPTVGDNPQSLLTGIGVMAVRYIDGRMTKEPDHSEELPPENTLELTGVKRWIFLWVLKHTRARVRDRENLRFERTRLFGRVRKIVVELGKRLVQQNRLSAPEDVFYLRISELMSAYPIDQATPRSFATIAAERKAVEQAFQVVPPDRFETRGDINQYKQFTPCLRTHQEGEAHDENTLKGMGACPGIVRGKVRVVTDPRNATLLEGEILVAQQTDPGWVVLFPAAAGLLVERGSMLSHSAIVARELQLPCIVSIRDITTLLQTGEEVEINGATGEIKRIHLNKTN